MLAHFVSHICMQHTDVVWRGERLISMSLVLLPTIEIRPADCGEKEEIREPTLVAEEEGVRWARFVRYRNGCGQTFLQTRWLQSRKDRPREHTISNQLRRPEEQTPCRFVWVALTSIVRGARFSLTLVTLPKYLRAGVEKPATVRLFAPPTSTRGSWAKLRVLRQSTDPWSLLCLWYVLDHPIARTLVRLTNWGTGAWRIFEALVFLGVALCEKPYSHLTCIILYALRLEGLWLFPWLSHQFLVPNNEMNL